MTNNLQGTIDLLILKTLAGGPNHGFGITLHIQEVSGGLLKVEEGSLYPALHRLDRGKLVDAEWKVSETARRPRYYKLPAKGRKALAAQTKTWDTLRKGVTKVLKFA